MIICLNVSEWLLERKETFEEIGRCCCCHMCLVASTKGLWRERVLNRATTLTTKLSSEVIFRTMTAPEVDFKHNDCIDNVRKVNTKQTQRNKKERRKEHQWDLNFSTELKLLITYWEVLEGSTEYRRAKVNVSAVFPRESFPLCRYCRFVVSRGSHCVLVFVPQTFPGTSRCSL